VWYVALFADRGVFCITVLASPAIVLVSPAVVTARGLCTPRTPAGESSLSLLCIVPAVGTGRKLFCLVPTVGTGMELMWTYVPYSWARAEDGTFAGRALGHEPGCIGCSRGIGGNPNNGPRVGDGGTHVPVDPIAGLWG